MINLIEETRNDILIFSICGDNASNNLKMAEIIELKYPYLIYVNCAAHSLQLLVKDILKIYPISNAFDVAKDAIKILRLKENKKNYSKFKLPKVIIPLKLSNIQKFVGTVNLNLSNV